MNDNCKAIIHHYDDEYLYIYSCCLKKHSETCYHESKYITLKNLQSNTIYFDYSKYCWKTKDDSILFDNYLIPSDMFSKEPYKIVKADTYDKESEIFSSHKIHCCSYITYVSYPSLKLLEIPLKDYENHRLIWKK